MSKNIIRQGLVLMLLAMVSVVFIQAMPIPRLGSLLISVAAASFIAVSLSILGLRGPATAA